MRPLSYSKFSLYDTCPLSYKFAYVDRLPEKPRPQYAFGRAVHKAIELFHRHDPAPAPLDVLFEYLEESWSGETYPSSEVEREYKDRAQRILTDFHRDELREYRPPMAVEFTFNVRVDDVSLTGRIDALYKLEDGTIEVLDYKSGHGDIDPGDVKESRQLAIYQMAVERALDARVSLLTIYQLGRRKRVSIPSHDEGYMEDMRRRIVIVANLIRAGMYEPRLNETCPCDWHEHCPYFKDLYRGKGQTLLPDHDETDTLVSDIDGIVRSYGEMVEAGETDSLEVRELASQIRRYCEQRDLLRVFSGDIVATLVPIRTPSDRSYWRLEMERTEDVLGHSDPAAPEREGPPSGD